MGKQRRKFTVPFTFLGIALGILFDKLVAYVFLGAGLGFLIDLWNERGIKGFTSFRGIVKYLLGIAFLSFGIAMIFSNSFAAKFWKYAMATMFAIIAFDYLSK